MENGFRCTAAVLLKKNKIYRKSFLMYHYSFIKKRQNLRKITSDVPLKFYLKKAKFTENHF